MFSSSSLRLFRLFGIDVFVSLFYGFLILLCVFYYGLAMGLIAAVAITLSIIIHEFGHALVCRKYELTPFIVLHGIGGVCVHKPASTDARAAWISLAGPLLQIVVGVAVMVGTAFGVASWEGMVASVVGQEGAGIGSAQMLLVSFLSIFSTFSIFWGVVNLVMPIWPLDGSKLFLVLLRRFMREEAAQTWTMRTGLVLAIPLAVWAFVSRQMLLGIILVQMAFSMWQILRSGVSVMPNASGRAPKVQLSEHAQEMLQSAEDAFATQDWQEAARMCHMLRAHGGQIPPKVMGRVWEVMGVATANLGEFKEAQGWLKRAPETKLVKEAKARCASGLGRG